MDSYSADYKSVFTVVERSRDGKKFWLRIGVAFVNRDGSLNVRLDAMPVNGQLHIRDAQRHERAAPLGDDLASLAG